MSKLFLTPPNQVLMAKRFRIGDVVYLKSEEDKLMTVEGYTSGNRFKDWWSKIFLTKIREQYVICVWQDDSGIKRVSVYHEDCLVSKESHG